MNEAFPFQCKVFNVLALMSVPLPEKPLKSKHNCINDNQEFLNTQFAFSA